MQRSVTGSGGYHQTQCKNHMNKWEPLSFCTGKYFDLNAHQRAFCTMKKSIKTSDEYKDDISSYLFLKQIEYNFHLWIIKILPLESAFAVACDLIDKDAHIRL